MSKKFFKNNRSIVAEIQQMENDERLRREDRATVSSFYNGAPPYSQEEADALGLNCNVNNLFGYDEMAKQKAQLMALYTKPTRLFEVELDAAPAALRQRWQMCATKKLNDIIRRSGRLKMQYQGVAGDGTMHGEGVFLFPNTTDWCPKHVPLSKRLIPSASHADVGSLTHFCVQTELPYSLIMRHAKNGSAGWNKEALNLLVSDVFSKEGAEEARIIYNNTDPGNPEDLEYQRQSNHTLDKLHRLKIPVDYFFQVNPESPGRPLDLKILARYGTRDDRMAEKTCLFEKENYYPTAKDALHAFFMDCMIGGEMFWNRVMGLGHLNYSLAWHVEVLLNRAMQASIEGTMNFWEVSNSASRETLERIIVKHNGILPEGVKFAQNRSQSDFNGLLAMVGLYRQQAAKNANNVTTGRTEDMLEVQAIAENDKAAGAQGGRISNWFDYMNELGAKIFERFTNPTILPHDSGYSEIKEFQDAMEREGVPLHYLQPSNVRVSTARIAGDGVRQKAIAEAQFLLSNINMYPPQAQQAIKRRATAAVTDDYELAEQLVPIEEAQPSAQRHAVMTENNTFLTSGEAMLFAGTTVPINDEDLHPIHIQAHFNLLGWLIQKGATQQNAFTEEQAAAFQTCGAHVLAHVSVVEQMGDKESAKLYRDELNNIAAMGQKMVNNLRQQQEAKGEQQQVDPIDAAKIELEAQKVELQREKFRHGAMKFERQQAHRENESALNNVLKMDKDYREEKATKQEMALRDIEAAEGIRQGRQAEQKPTE